MYIALLHLSINVLFSALPPNSYVPGGSVVGFVGFVGFGVVGLVGTVGFVGYLKTDK